jgi:ribosomal protein S1
MKPTKTPDFASLLEESFKKRKNLETGSRHTAKIITLRDDFLFIKTPEKLQGIVSMEEFQGMETPIENSEIQVFFLRENHGDYYFTTALSGEDINHDNLQLAMEREIPIWGQYASEATGGYDVRIGEFSAFCPYSQIDPNTKSKSLQGVRSKFVVHEINSKTRRIVLSSKKLSDKEKELKKEILKDELKEGSFVTCTIKSIHPFGLIVDMNGFDALVPSSESSFKKNLDLNKEFQIGQIIRGKIIGLDWKDNKISISLKDSLDDPWLKNIPLKEGDIVTATVDIIKPFGMFVRFNDHFHGLVSNKESGLPHRIPLSSHYKQGDTIEVFITEVNPSKKQIAASISKAKEAKEKLDYQSYISDQSVSHVSSFGLLLQKNLNKK